MQRVIIIGAGGAGKSTFARRLGRLTGLEVLHLDKLYWQAGWREPAKNEWRESVEELLASESWIMDGNFGGTLELRLAAADTAVFLDLPPLVCLYRVIKRRLKYHNTNRPDMAAGCNEKLDLKFLNWVWSYRKTTKPRIEAKLKAVAGEKKIFHLKSQQEIEEFFIRLSATSNANQGLNP